MQLTHVEINEKRLYTLLRDLNSGKDIDMNELGVLCASYNWELKQRCNCDTKPNYYIQQRIPL